MKLLTGTGRSRKRQYASLATVFLAMIMAEEAHAQQPTAESVGQKATAATTSANGDKPDNSVITVTARRGYVATNTDAGTKMTTPLIETPQAISVISQDQIQLLQIQNLEQATRYTSGIVSGSYGPDSRFDWLTLRGFTPTLYLDGLQLPTASVAEAQSRLDTFGLQEIEIVKGPSSALYGAVPPGGFVSMVSKRPQSKPFAEITGQYGSFDHYQGSFDGGTTLAGGALLVRLTSLFRDGNTQVDFAHERRFFIAPAITWRIAPGAELTVLSHYQYDRDNSTIQYLPAAGTLLSSPTGRIPTSFYTSDPDHDIYRRRTYDIGYDFNWRLSSGLTLHQNVKYTKLAVYYDTIYAAGFTKGDDGVTPADYRTIQRYTYLVKSSPSTLGIDTHGEWDGDTGPVRHQLLFGVDYRHQFDNSQLGYALAPSIDLLDPVYHRTDIVDPPISQYNVIKQDQTGLYVQDHAKLGHLAITGSLRHDWARTSNRDEIYGGTTVQHDQAWSGRIGANLLFDNGLAPYASYSKSFQPVVGVDADGNAFKPDRGTAYEGGVKYQPSGFKGLFTLSAYHIILDNLVSYDNLGEAFQTGQVRSQGIEFEGSIRVNDALSVNVAYTYTDAKTTGSLDPTQLGKRVLLVPRHAASALADYTIRSGRLLGFGFGGGVRYVGDVYGDPTNAVRTPSYTLVDALLHYDLPRWRFALNVNNLFDHVYLTSCYSLDSCTYGTRRSVLFTASLHL